MKKMQLGIMAIGLAGAMCAQASLTAFAPISDGVVPNEGAGNDGLFFTPNVTISVTALGYLDDGWTATHEVGLYDVSAASLLANATPTGSSTLSGGFRYESITPLLLTAGHQYAVVGVYPTQASDTGIFASNVGAASEITFNGYKYNSSGVLSLPTTDYSPPIFGPNFQFAVVPEATTMFAGVLLLLPFGASTLRLLRKSKGVA